MIQEDLAIGKLHGELKSTKAQILRYLKAQDNWSLALLEGSLSASLIRIRTLKNIQESLLSDQIFGSKYSTSNHSLLLSDKESLWANQ